MIEVENLTKAYGPTKAVDDLSFTVRPGIVTGFLGPNGAGKSTTMRAILGLDRPTSGRATVNGRSFADHPAPLTQIGSLLEAKAVHPRRSARNHLRALAATTGIPDRRVDELLDLVGLSEVADRTAGGFSLGMGQRLGIASALLGDSETVMLDEPVNGLDPEGIVWIRNLLKGLAAEGRTVLVSSHLMAEMALTAEHFVIIGRGRLIADVTVEQLAAQSPAQTRRGPHVAGCRRACAGTPRRVSEHRGEHRQTPRPVSPATRAPVAVSGICGGHWHVLAARNVPGIGAFDDLVDMWMKGMNVVHRGLSALSDGRLGSAVMGMTAVELHVIGRTSGRRRSVMLTAPIYEPERVVLVASKGGDDRHPEWYRNLVANPDVELTVGGTTRPMRAYTADAIERDELWPRIVAAYRGYADYQRRTEREIPVVVLVPR
jgi:ABC-2 type transport system ATP-binding protein